MTPTRILVACGAFAAVACTSVAPLKINQGDACFRCQRAITDTKLAAQQIGFFNEKFRTPGCMAKYLVNNPKDKGTAFVTDYATGKAIPPENAYYVQFIVDDRTGERDYRAYRLQGDADAFAAEVHSTPMTWQTVLDNGR